MWAPEISLYLAVLKTKEWCEILCNWLNCTCHREERPNFPPIHLNGSNSIYNLGASNKRDIRHMLLQKDNLTVRGATAELKNNNCFLCRVTFKKNRVILSNHIIRMTNQISEKITWHILNEDIWSIKYWIMFQDKSSLLHVSGKCGKLKWE